ncbi:MAG: hypothetical protein IT303_00815 [Dehalococcoidia bacterium]|nr:hypothetical protein [Dehalococcoidia bacterium]
MTPANSPNARARRLRASLAALLIAVALAAVASSCADAATPGSSGGSPAADDPGPRFGPTPTVAPQLPLDDALARLQQEHPRIAETTAAFAAGDLDTVMAGLTWDQLVCFPDGLRRAPRSLLCSILGVPEGTLVEAFSEDMGVELLRERSNVLALFRTYIEQGKARLELIAKRDDGRVAVSFALDEVPSDVTTTTITSVYFTFLPEDDGLASYFKSLVPGSTSIDQLRNDELFVPESDSHKWDIWGMSDELRAREEAKHDERYEGPEARATPRTP